MLGCGDGEEVEVVGLVFSFLGFSRVREKASMVMVVVVLSHPLARLCFRVLFIRRNNVGRVFEI